MAPYPSYFRLQKLFSFERTEKCTKLNTSDAANQIFNINGNTGYNIIVVNPSVLFNNFHTQSIYEYFKNSEFFYKMICVYEIDTELIGPSISVTKIRTSYGSILKK